MRDREHELVECRECGRPFNLAAQWYYDDLCPSCKADEDGEEVTWPACVRCGDKVNPDDIESVRVVNRARGGTERVGMCPSCAEMHRGRRPA